mmetsp:Transcript_63707/g.149337  ORF Transcript_63707/g.149337 Transcript_63707/m.149337 type:complete len:93 (+) Transcript_63707:250-528(+)
MPATTMYTNGKRMPSVGLPDPNIAVDHTSRKKIEVPEKHTSVGSTTPFVSSQTAIPSRFHRLVLLVCCLLESGSFTEDAAMLLPCFDEEVQT